MSQFLTPFFGRSPLERELRDLDTRQLRDIGLLRAADGSLRLLDDPGRPVIPGTQPAAAALFHRLSPGTRFGPAVTARK